MAGIMINIKWGKEQIPASVAPTDTPAKLFEQLEQKTGVPVARQKLMAKGAWRGVLKENMSLADLKPNQNVTLMGTAERLVEPATKTVFIEDLKEEDKAKSGMCLPAGFANLGNTCYMNSTLQCLRAVPELRESLEKNGAADQELAGALAATYVRRAGSPFDESRRRRGRDANRPRSRKSRRRRGRDADSPWRQVVAPPRRRYLATKRKVSQRRYVFREDAPSWRRSRPTRPSASRPRRRRDSSKDYPRRGRGAVSAGRRQSDAAKNRRDAFSAACPARGRGGAASRIIQLAAAPRRSSPLASTVGAGTATSTRRRDP